MSNLPLVGLVIDDDKQSNNLLVTMLHRIGLDAYGLLDGQNTLAEIAALNPDIVFVDLYLPRPGDNGIEIIQKIRADETYQKLPIVVVTAGQSPRDVEEAHAAGCDVFLRKPYLRAEIEESVDAIFGVST